MLFSVSVFARVPPMTCNTVALDPAKYRPEELKSYYCEMNFQCTVNALNTEDIVWDDVDQRREYSRENDCNDELKLAAMMMEIAKDPPSLQANVRPEVNQSERNEMKDTLPIIPDAPSGSSTVRQE